LSVYERIKIMNMITLNAAKRAAQLFMAGAYPDRTWFIIGGALRDTDRGVAFKDIDIFVSGYSTDPLPEEGTDDGQRNAHLMRAFIQPWMGFELNIVFLRGTWDLKRTADRCDYGICQAGWCPVTDETYRSNQYLLDAKYKTLTLCRDTLPERKERMQAKFEGWLHFNPKNFLISNNVSFFVYNSDTQSIEEVSPSKQGTKLPANNDPMDTLE